MTQEEVATGLAIQGVIFAVLAIILMFVFLYRADTGWQAKAAARPVAILAYVALGIAIASWLVATWVGVSV